MTITNVDGLSFDIPEEFRATKYDDWVFYRNRINHIKDSKAIDLIVLAINLTVVYLVEVKDFRDDPVTRERRTRTKPSELHDEVAAKILDTLGGILAARLSAHDVNEQNIASETCRTRSLRIVLHLEQSPQTRLFQRLYDPANLQIKLRQRLRARLRMLLRRSSDAALLRSDAHGPAAAPLRCSQTHAGRRQAAPLTRRSAFSNGL